MPALVIQRRAGEALTLTTWEGEDIEIRVRKIAPGRVSILILAPPNIFIRRSELLARRKKGKSQQ